MLARSALALYWMGRYLERAEQLCRLLQLQVESLVDRPVEEIQYGWSRIYASLRRQPPGGDLGTDAGEDYVLADSFTLADDLTFERSNPDSVRRCLALGRENARQVRNCISPEMWTCLNLCWLRIRDLGIEDIWKVSPESFYAETAREIYTFTGVAEATMYRDEGWRFMQAGRFIERAQLLASILLVQLAGRMQGGISESGWTNLLHAFQAFETYKRRYSVEVQADRVLDLLVTDPLLPGSLCRSLERLDAGLAATGPAPGARAGAAAARLSGRLGALIRYDWPDCESLEDKEALLDRVGEDGRKLHGLVTAAYIDYAVEDAPVH